MTVEVPPKKGGRKSKYNLRDLVVGGPPNTFKIRSNKDYRRIQVACSNGGRLQNKKFTTRKNGNTVDVYRIE